MHGLGEVVRRGVDIAPVELGFVRERDRVHDEIERTPGLLDGREDGIEGRGFRYVTMADDETLHFGGERLDPLLERVTLVGEGELRPGGAACLGDSPCDRAIVGDTHDEAALAAHETVGIRHEAQILSQCVPSWFLAGEVRMA